MHRPLDNQQQRTFNISFNISLDFLCPDIAKQRTSAAISSPGRKPAGRKSRRKERQDSSAIETMIVIRIQSPIRNRKAITVSSYSTPKLAVSKCLPAPRPFIIPFPFYKNPNSQRPRHYLFGYGSLINPQSRLRTVPYPTSAIPVTVRGMQRSWSYRCPRKEYTAVGVSRVPFSNGPAFCNGVLIPIENPEIELPRLDQRECNYTRSLISLSDLEFAHSTYAKRFQLSPDALIWVYELPSNKLQHTPSPTTPIPQSYVDCILAGCLLYGATFAHQFIEQTAGWDAGTWVNDRNANEEVRRYIKCKLETRTIEPDVVDSMLKNVVPMAFDGRIEL